MVENLKGLEFDPGFGPYVYAFRMTVKYLYMDINKYKNFSQKRAQFKQYYKKIIELYDNNIGFYIGCLMWAAYIKTQPKQEILHNTCFGEPYNEQANTKDTDYLTQYYENFPKDMKYFMGVDYSVDKYNLEILKLYREFLILNKGFVESKYNTDILLPEGMNTLEIETYKDKIEEVLKSENLSNLMQYKELLCQI